VTWASALAPTAIVLCAGGPRDLVAHTTVCRELQSARRANRCRTRSAPAERDLAEPCLAIHRRPGRDRMTPRGPRGWTVPRRDEALVQPARRCGTLEFACRSPGDTARCPR